MSPASDLSGHTGYPFHLKKVLKQPTVENARARIDAHCIDVFSGVYGFGDPFFDIQEWRDRASMPDAEFMNQGADTLSKLSITTEVQVEELAGEPFSMDDLKTWTREFDSFLVDKCQVVRCR